MSEENLEVVKSLLPAPIDLAEVFATEETIDAIRLQFESLVQPDFVTVHDPKAVPMGIGTPTGDGVSVGIEGFITLWRDYLSAWESWLVTPTEFREAGDEKVLVLMSYRGRSKTHGVEIELQGGNVFTLRDGRLARLEMFLERRGALEAAGLSE